MIVYIGICSERGRLVCESDAAAFVQDRGVMGDPAVIIPWFFSGNWVKKEIRDPALQESLISGQDASMLLAAGLFDE